MNEIILGNCFDVMMSLPSKSVNLIATDLPYGVTNLDYDKVPFDLVRLWQCVKHVLVDNGLFISTSVQPFTTDLINSNRDWFKYCLSWDKCLPTGHYYAKFKPMSQHEDIILFGNGVGTYNPIMRKGKYRQKGSNGGSNGVYSSQKSVISFNDQYNPTSIITISNANQSGKQHPNQKPIDLYEYLILTYSNPDDVVLDPTCGSGTTCIAAYNTGRRFIGIEQNEEYHRIACKRLAEVRSQLRFESMVG